MSSKFIPIVDIPKYRELLPRLLHPRVIKVFTRLLQRFENVLGHRLCLQLPKQYADYADNFEAQRALRIISNLLHTGYLIGSHTRRPNHPDEPTSYISILDIKNTHLMKFGWSGKSVHLFKQAPTFWPALGEAVERMCTLNPHYQKYQVVKSSYRKLTKPKLNIFDIAGLTQERRAQGSTQHILTYDEDSIFSWIPTEELTSNTVIYAPLQWFSFTYVMDNLRICKHQNAVEPLLTAPITTGAAAGQTRNKAILAGLFEVIERDAFIIYWLNQMQAKRIDMADIKNDEIQKLLQIANDYRLETQILYLQTDVPIHTICLVVIDRTGIGPAVMVTAKTGVDIESMIISMLHDSLGQRSGARNMRIHHKLSETELRAETLSHRGRMVYWHNPEQVEKIEHFISGTLVPRSELPKYELTGITNKDLDVLLTWFKEKKYQVLYRELISPELKKLTEGLSVAMVKVPKMQPVYLEETLRSTAGDRLREVPAYLGYPVPKDGPDPFYKEPHPFP